MKENGGRREGGRGVGESEKVEVDEEKEANWT